MGQRRDICDRRRTYDELAAIGRNFGRGFCNIKFYSGEFRCEKFYPAEFRSGKFAMKFSHVEFYGDEYCARNSAVAKAQNFAICANST